MPDSEDAAIKRVLQDRRFKVSILLHFYGWFLTFSWKNRELQIMRIIRHPNIVELKAFYYSNGERVILYSCWVVVRADKTQRDEVYLNLVLEFVPETVYRASRYFSRMRTTMPMIEVKLYIYQLFRSLAYIHSQGICHRDIKPQNLLLDPNTGALKLCDFGSAKILVENEPNVSYICSRYYRAPELIFGATNYTTKIGMQVLTLSSHFMLDFWHMIDVWSTGCVMAELMLGQPMFPGETGIDQLVEIIKILGTPTREQIRTMNPNYMEHRFPQIRPHPFTRVWSSLSDKPVYFLLTRFRCFAELHRKRLIWSRRYWNIHQHNDFRPSRRFVIHFLMNFGILTPNFQTLVIQEALHESCLLFLISRDMVCSSSCNESRINFIELSISPSLNDRLVPPHARPALIAQGIDIDNFTPLTKEEMMAHLDWLERSDKWVMLRSMQIFLFLLAPWSYIYGDLLTWWKKN